MTSTYNGNPHKVRIGIGLGAWPFGPITPASVLDFIDRCEALDIDSIWLSDRSRRQGRPPGAGHFHGLHGLPD